MVKQTTVETPETKREAARVRVQQAYDQRAEASRLAHEANLEVCRRLYVAELNTVEDIYHNDLASAPGKP